jgi:hypothetical protein
MCLWKLMVLIIAPGLPETGKLEERKASQNLQSLALAGTFRHKYLKMPANNGVSLLFPLDVRHTKTIQGECHCEVLEASNQPISEWF